MIVSAKCNIKKSETDIERLMIIFCNMHTGGNFCNKIENGVYVLSVL